MESPARRVTPRGSPASSRAGSEKVDLIFGDVLCKPGEQIRHVYFPTASFISLVTPLDGAPRREVVC